MKQMGSGVLASYNCTVPTEPDNLRFEIGHVLFIDIVGYSKLLIEEQKERLNQLTAIVLATAQVRDSTDEQLVRLPTGDGMALVFHHSAEEPARCALEIAEALRKHPELPVRMGIHSGPVSEVTDVSGRSNIAGAGINMAQRVMDCGDAGHILLSQHVADDLVQYRQWAPRLQDIGECEVKHGVRLHISSLYHDGLGNSEVPSKLKPTVAPLVLPERKSHHPILLVAAAAVIIASLTVFWFTRKHAAPPVASTAPQKSIAVLPFENLSSDKENAYFADGIQDEILTRLASIADLKVISRTSTAKYKSKPEDLRTVAQQLGVANVLEGSVQRAADKVRVNVQLIDARADSHLWAKSFDRDVKDVFAVESEVSQEIADALQAKLSSKEASNLAAAPTRNSEAYDLFLKGEYAQHAAESALTGEGFDQASALYEQAIARDPTFALAIARWVESRCYRQHFGNSLSDVEIRKVREAAEHAVTLAPDIAETHTALGLFYYFGVFQYDRALAELQRALVSEPNNVRALRFLAGIHARQGQVERGLSELKKCEELDPRDPAITDNIGAAYLNLRMWEDAKRTGLHSLALDPRNVAGMHVVFFSYLDGTGDIKEATHTLRTFEANTGSSGFIPGGYIAIINLDAYLSVVARDFGAAYRAWGNESSDPNANRLRLSARAVIHVFAGDAADAQPEIEQARVLVEAKLREQPDDADSVIQLSWINLALKRDAEAIKLANKAAASVPMEKDALAGAFCLAALAEIQARASQPAEAIKTLQRLLSIPAGQHASIQRLKIDPVWDPIRNDPGFQQLLAGKEQIGPNK